MLLWTPFFLALALLAGTSTTDSPIPASSLQALLVRTPDWPAQRGSLQRFQRARPGASWTPVGEPFPVTLGRGGMGWGRGLHPAEPGPGPVKAEGDGRSPAGVFRLSAVFGLVNPRSEPGGLPFYETTETLEAVDDGASRYYNRIVDRSQVADPDWQSSERMRIELYRVGIVVDHNADPPLPGAGSCIFLHLWKGETEPTAGCTASTLPSMAMLAGWLEAEAHPVLVQLPEAEYQRLRQPWSLP